MHMIMGNLRHRRTKERVQKLKFCSRSRSARVPRAPLAFRLQYRSVYSQPERRPRVGRASAARRPHAVELASDRSDHSDASAACGRWRNGSDPHTIEVRNEL